MAVTEKLGQFYLGRVYDPESDRTTDVDVLYDAKDLTTHAVCVGMTGSGKTGLCLSLLEEAAIDGIPAICIDPKGDLGNLMLTFPGLTAAEFQPWIDSSEASRKGMTVAEYAQQTADTWRKGLEEWGQGPERIQRLRDAAEVAIYTPASNAGRPLTVLKSFDAPPAALLEDSEGFRERILSAVSGLLALMQIDADPISSREHILLSNILETFWREGRSVDMGTLIRAIQSPPFERVGFMDLDSFYPSKDRFKLAMALNNLLASPSFAPWMEGEALNVPSLMYTPEGKPRIAIISIAHLTDQERMFFVTILLNEVLAWIRTQPGTSSLRALLYMDEVFGYFPPTANPPSKRPMLTLLKQARAFGLGCVLATQNPVDLDYKGLSNAGTWFLGRLQTERDKMRVLEGLEGAASSAGAGFDRQRMEQILAGLGGRVFLMNNVHEDAPVVFKSRWALSYLRGPVTRQQIEILMEPLKNGPGVRQQPTFGLQAEREESPSAGRPILPPEVPELFFPVRRSVRKILYRPALLGQGRVHFVSSKQDVDTSDDVTLLRLADAGVAADFWEHADEWDEASLPELTRQPEHGAEFHGLPPELTQAKNYKTWENALEEFLYRSRRLLLWTCAALKESSRPEESEADFRIRLRHVAHEERDAQVEKLRAKYASKFRTLDDQIQRAEQKLERERTQRSQKSMTAGVSVLTGLAGALFGRKLMSAATISRAGTAIRSANAVAKEAEDIRQASEVLNTLLERRDDLNADVEGEIQMIQDAFDPGRMHLDQEEVKPRKSDVNIQRVTLVWLPWSVEPDGSLQRVF
ncbi:MAG: DUF87 domain-containing protein [Planctomycetaceae bacterium]